jgi:predicted transcriptional regulator
VDDERHLSVFPGFRQMAERRHALCGQLTALRHQLRISQVELASRMGTSQSAVARFEAGDLDVRLSTVERYAAALGGKLEWRIEHDER